MATKSQTESKDAEASVLGERAEKYGILADAFVESATSPTGRMIRKVGWIFLGCCAVFVIVGAMIEFL
ncbi:MAG: hypothetical protein AAF713_12640 [Pseudomonadota bacterium]